MSGRAFVESGSYAGKLLARLAAKGPVLGITSGGIPSLTNTDIAGAAGSALSRGRLAVWIVLAKWLPGEIVSSAVSTGPATRDAMEREQRLFGILSNMTAAKMTTWPETAPAPLVERWSARWDGDWPKSRDYARALTAAAFREWLAPQRCHVCNGNGTVEVRAKTEICGECDGQGLVGQGQKRRARALNVRQTDFTHYIAPQYEWLLSVLQQLERDGANAILHAIGREE